MLCAVSEPSATAEPGPGKGRPTPKRRDAQKKRRQAIPGNPKEAAKVRRERAKQTRALQRKALLSGDEKHLPMRDAGPAKRLARDIVDTRFTLGQIFFGLILVVLFATIVTSPGTKHVNGKVVQQANTTGAFVTLLSIVVLIAVFVDSIRIGRRARREVEERFGAKQSVGITGYATIRAMQPRRLRRPPPALKRGETPRQSGRDS
jgi:hypothetical protein